MTRIMKIHSETLEEVNLLFEMIKIMLLTGLSQTQISKYLKRYSHFEIRNDRYINGQLVVEDLIAFDKCK